MAINILLSTMGYLFVAHFCAGEMKSASMIVNATSSCCAADEIENIATEDNTGCCKDEYQFFKIKDQFVPSFQVQINFPILAISLTRLETPIYASLAKCYTLNKIEYPPGAVQQQQIVSTSVLRIWK